MVALSVKASGMVTSVGFNAPASLAAMRAGIRGVSFRHLWDWEAGEKIACGKVGVPQWWEGLGKLAELAAPAILECLEAARDAQAKDIPILLAVAAPDRPCRWPGLEEEILDEIEYKLGLSHHPASMVVARGQVGGVVGIQEAWRLIANKNAPYCVVAGVDSFLMQEMIEPYMEKRRVLTPLNSNGFSPGEAACAVLLGPAGNAPKGDLDILATHVTREKALIESEDPLRAEGLTEAIRHVLGEAKLSFDDMDYRITDLNGEHYKFKEATFAAMRFERKPREKLFELWHPIEYLGEVGASIVPCALAVALDAGMKEYSPGPTVLCHFSNDDGERAALIGRFRRS
jgi:3-oxoacyl-[acyl-carrier-protein] synthase-1